MGLRRLLFRLDERVLPASTLRYAYRPPNDDWLRPGVRIIVGPTNRYGPFSGLIGTAIRPLGTGRWAGWLVELDKSGRPEEVRLRTSQLRPAEPDDETNPRRKPDPAKRPAGDL